MSLPHRIILPNLSRKLMHMMNDGSVSYDEFTKNCIYVLNIKNERPDDESVRRCIKQMHDTEPELTSFLPKDHEWFKILST